VIFCLPSTLYQDTSFHLVQLNVVLTETKRIVDFLQEYRATGYVIWECLNRNNVRNVRETELSEISVKRKSNENATNNSPEKMSETSTVLIILDRDIMVLKTLINKRVICRYFRISFRFQGKIEMKEHLKIQCMQLHMEHHTTLTP